MFALVPDARGGPSDGTTAPFLLATLTGTLTRSDLPRLRTALAALLSPARPVILDVSQVTASYPPAVGVLSRTLLAAGGWPAARLVVTGPDARFRAALRSTGTIRDVVVADDVEQALAHLHDRPERVSRRLSLRPGTATLQRALAFVDRAVDDWDAHHLRRETRLITAELVRAGRAPAVLTITHGPEGLRIALRDFTAHPTRVPAGGGRRAANCGVTPRSDGNVVWAVPARTAVSCFGR